LVGIGIGIGIGIGSGIGFRGGRSILIKGKKPYRNGVALKFFNQPIRLQENLSRRS
jgi:hypothetical protein